MDKLGQTSEIFVSFSRAKTLESLTGYIPDLLF